MIARAGLDTRSYPRFSPITKNLSHWVRWATSLAVNGCSTYRSVRCSSHPSPTTYILISKLILPILPTPGTALGSAACAGEIVDMMTVGPPVAVSLSLNLNRGSFIVQRRIVGEEIRGDQAETGGMYRHEWPVFRPRYVRDSQRVPHNDVLPVNRPIGLGPCRQPLLCMTKIDVLARCEHLIRAISGYP